MNKPILELQNVKTIVNKGTSNETTILKGLNLKINAGDFITIVGTNGAGKSTLFNVIGGISTLMKEEFFITVMTLLKQLKNNELPFYRVFSRILNWELLPG